MPCLLQDVETLQRQVEELQAANDKLDKSKKKLQAELEDSNIDLETQRAKVIELEKKQRNFDKVLSEEKVSKRQEGCWGWEKHCKQRKSAREF